MSDIQMFVAAVQAIEAHDEPPSRHSYLYEFAVELQTKAIPSPNWFHGANHMDELVYVFGAPFLEMSTFGISTSRNGTDPTTDKMLARGIMAAWSNYAKSG